MLSWCRITDAINSIQIKKWIEINIDEILQVSAQKIRAGKPCQRYRKASFIKTEKLQKTAKCGGTRQGW